MKIDEENKQEATNDDAELINSAVESFKADNKNNTVDKVSVDENNQKNKGVHSNEPNRVYPKNNSNIIIEESTINETKESGTKLARNNDIVELPEYVHYLFFSNLKFQKPITNISNPNFDNTSLEVIKDEAMKNVKDIKEGKIQADSIKSVLSGLNDKKWLVLVFNELYIIQSNIKSSYKFEFNRN